MIESGKRGELFRRGRNGQCFRAVTHRQICDCVAGCGGPWARGGRRKLLAIPCLCAVPWQPENPAPADRCVWVFVWTKVLRPRGGSAVVTRQMAAPRRVVRLPLLGGAGGEGCAGFT